MGYYYDTEEVDLASIVGKTFKSVEKIDDDVIVFVDSEGVEYKMYHEQDCCEGVTIEDICGDLQDLVGSPITQAEEVTNTGSVDRNYETDKLTINGEWPEGVPLPEYREDSYTWTFYKLATINGSVTIRWYGSSNGYYSERVYFRKKKGEGE